MIRPAFTRRELLALMSSGALAACAPSGLRRSSGSSLIHADAIAQAGMIARGEASASEIINAAITRIERVNPAINAVITPNFAAARARAAGSESGRLWGVPYLLKDLNPYPGLRFTRGSRLFRDGTADWIAPYTKASEDAGLIVLGKTNTPEFGLTSTTESVLLGPCRNPWNLNYSTGGSSGGAAAAVAARLTPIAQASDGGGSIRLPAANCGLVGLKPSRGRFVQQFPESRGERRPRQIAVMHPVSWSVRDSALMLALTEKQSGGLPPTGFVTGSSTRKRRIAMSLRDGEGRMPDKDVIIAVEKTARLLADMGHEVAAEENSPLDDPAAVEHFITYWAFGAAQIRDGAAQAYQGNLTDVLERWTLDLASIYDEKPAGALDAALDHFAAMEARVNTFFGQWDAWLTPATGYPAPEIGYQSPMLDFATHYDRISRFAAYTPLHNVAGTPAISLPMHWTQKGIPVGVQISAAFGRENLLLDFAYALEEAENWGERLPPVHG